MKIYYSLNEVPRPENGCVLTVGNFDGVHLGHQAIIERARQLASVESLPLVGMTFEPAPVRVIRPEKAPRLLSPLGIKILQLADQHLDELVVAESTGELLSQSPEDFARRILVERLNVRHVVEGQTFGFGWHREGTMMTLQQLGRELGFQAHMVLSRKIDLGSAKGVAVSSSLIRQEILHHRYSIARKCLGDYYTLAGWVVPGRGFGKKLGYPTANLKLYSEDQLVPEDGVYAGYARVGEDVGQAWRQSHRYKAAISIGRCGTFSDGQWQIEAYLLDYPPEGESLYDKHMLFSLVERIRPQQKFTAEEPLRQAIENDCVLIENVLQKSVEEQ